MSQGENRGTVLGRIAAQLKAMAREHPGKLVTHTFKGGAIAELHWDAKAQEWHMRIRRLNAWPSETEMKVFRREFGCPALCLGQAQMGKSEQGGWLGYALVWSEGVTPEVMPRLEL